MNCDETRRWLDAQLDGELDLARDEAVVAHLRACAPCAALAAERRAWRTKWREELPRFAPPPELAERIRAELRAAGDAAPAPAARVTSGVFGRWWPALAAAGVALAVGFAWGRHDGRGKGFETAVIASHSLALTSGRLWEVASSDRHTVKPWLAEHVDFSPPVVDLGAEGFPLGGARVERIDGHQVAALVYHRFKHVVTLYVWPEQDAPPPAATVQRGYAVRGGREQGFSFAAVSDVAAEELDVFVARVRTEIARPGEQR